MGNKSTIYLIGYMASGKSSIGSLIAQQLGYDFIDTDLYIENRFRQNISDIFRDSGEAYFRFREHNILKELAGLDNSIISTGGGMPIHHNNINLMLNSGTVVFLNLSIKTLCNRLYRGRYRRPKVSQLSKKEIRQLVEQELKQRTPIYQQAHIIINEEELGDKIYKKELIARYIIDRLELKPIEQIPAKSLQL